MLLANFFPFPEANAFYQFLCCLAALLAAILLGLNVWSRLFPGKSSENSPVARREFDELKKAVNGINENIVEHLTAISSDIAALKAGAEARQEQFNSTMHSVLKTNAQNIERLHDRVSALEQNALNCRRAALHG